MTKLSDIDVSNVTDPAMAAALQRRAEAERQIITMERRRQARTGEKTADKLAESIIKGLKAVAEMKVEQPPVDLEGTKAPFADRPGNFAKDAVAAKRGGVGVSDSNTDEDAPDMSHGQGPGHDHPDLRGPNEGEMERAAAVVRNQPVDSNGDAKRGPGRPRKNGDK